MTGLRRGNTWSDRSDQRGGDWNDRLIAAPATRSGTNLTWSESFGWIRDANISPRTAATVRCPASQNCRRQPQNGQPAQGHDCRLCHHNNYEFDIGLFCKEAAERDGSLTARRCKDAVVNELQRRDRR